MSAENIFELTQRQQEVIEFILLILILFVLLIQCQQRREAHPYTNIV